MPNLRGSFKTYNYTSAQTNTLLVPAGTKGRIFLMGAVFTAHGLNVASPRVAFNLGNSVAIEHPGVPAGGGLVASGLEIMGDQGADLTVSCGDPGAGSVSITAVYRVE